MLGVKDWLVTYKSTMNNYKFRWKQSKICIPKVLHIYNYNKLFRNFTEKWYNRMSRLWIKIVPCEPFPRFNHICNFEPPQKPNTNCWFLIFAFLNLDTFPNGPNFLQMWITWYKQIMKPKQLLTRSPGATDSFAQRKYQRSLTFFSSYFN